MMRAPFIVEVTKEKIYTKEHIVFAEDAASAAVDAIMSLRGDDRRNFTGVDKVRRAHRLGGDT